MVIQEKWHWNKALESSPTKKGKIDDSKGKETMPPPTAKKTKSSREAGRGSLQPIAPEEGTSASPRHLLGPRASVMARASMVEKIMAEVILPTTPDDREKVKKLSLDQLITKVEKILARYLFAFFLGFNLYSFVDSWRS